MIIKRSYFWVQLIDWLMQDDQKELFELVFAVTVNLVFLALAALLLWPLDRSALTFRLAKGYGVFWVAIYLTSVLVALFRRIFRVDMYSRFQAYVISALAVSGFLQAGWSAFAASAVGSFAPGVPIWGVLILYLVGVLSCYVAFVEVSSVYEGHVYKFFNLPLGLVSFAVFSVWPAAGRAAYGWFFDLF